MSTDGIVEVIVPCPFFKQLPYFGHFYLFLGALAALYQILHAL